MKKRNDMSFRIILAFIIYGILTIFSGCTFILQDEFPEPDYTEVLSNYTARLDIYLPVRLPDYCYDDHGGMVGDGDTIIILNLSEREKGLLDNDTADNKNWLSFPLSNEDASNLYGADYCDNIENGGTLCINGLLDDRVKRIDKGYYCIYNKQTEKLEFPDYSAASANFIFVEYDVENNTLYIQEFDS